MGYTPQMNIKTVYNFQESLISIDDYLDFALSNGFKYAFYSDKNTMYGAAEFADKFSKAGIKPIIGLTYEFELDQKITIGLYAKNKEGYKNISFISSEINTSNNDYVKNIQYIANKIDDNNIFVISFEKEFNNKLVESITKNINENNVYFGVDEKNSAMIQEEKIVFYNSINYLNEEDKKFFNLFLAVKNGEVYSSDKDLDRHYPVNDELYKVLKSSNDNIEKIANKINFDLFENSEIHLTQYKTPNNIPQRSFLRALTEDSLNSYVTKNKIPNKNVEIYKNRLNYELGIIEEMNFVNYFLVVWDYVKFAKENNILVGPGRGSAAGSLVSFLLRITTVDPLQYNLLFERFLNPERQTMPDIDIDFQDTKRDQVIEYIFEKYGITKVASIVTFSTSGIKSAIRDSVRVLGKEVDLANKITKLIPNDLNINFDQVIQNSKMLSIYYENNKEIFDFAKRIMGLPRQTGTHAAGMIISDVDLREILPVKVGFNGVWQTQYPMEYLERLGLIKMDLLGLKNLSILQDIKESVEQEAQNGKKIILENIPLKDNKVYELLNSGKTTGIFQLESPGMTNLLMRMKARNIEDLSVTSAIFRPGPKEMIPEYLNRRNNHQNISNYIIDPSLINILSTTNGIILYQEQVIQILQKVGGFSLGKADIVRRAMSKKNHEYMESVKQEFLNGAIRNGYQEVKAREIWEWIDRFASYGFNKSHSIAYSYISYWLAFFKTYQPEHFYTALFNSGASAQKINTYIKEVKAFGIGFRGPSLNYLREGFVSSNKTIFSPLTMVKGIGPDMIKKVREVYILEKRENEKNNSNKKTFSDMYLTLSKLVSAGLNRTTLEALIWSGALDIYGYERLLLINNIDVILTFAEFNSGNNEIDDKLIPILDDNYDKNDYLVAEKELEYLGFYLTKNPFANLRNEYQKDDVVTLEFIKDKSKIDNSIFIVNSLRTKKDKNGNTMAFLEIQDDTISLSATLFARDYEEIKDKVFEKNVIEAVVEVQFYNDRNTAVIRKINKIIK